MNVTEINRYVKILVGNLSFSMDYNNLVNGSKRLLIVEGQTDKKFIEGLLNDDVICIVANKAFGVSKDLSQERINCKDAIIKVVYGMSKIPMVIDCPKGADSWSIFGMIDLDFDESSHSYMSVSKLFVTDTHDIETLMISTDRNLMQRIEKCVIAEDDITKALYLSYQIGCLRQVLYASSGKDFSLKPLSSGVGTIDYSYFIKGCEINLRKMVEYINANNEEHLSDRKLDKILQKCVSDKLIKKRVDKSYCWNGKCEDFNPDGIPDFWKTVNGHDILSLLCFLNSDVAKVYIKGGALTLNRDFELDLIANYEYTALEKTKLYTDMRIENVVKEL